MTLEYMLFVLSLMDTYRIQYNAVDAQYELASQKDAYDYAICTTGDLEGGLKLMVQSIGKDFYLPLAVDANEALIGRPEC